MMTDTDMACWIRFQSLELSRAGIELSRSVDSISCTATVPGQEPVYACIQRLNPETDDILKAYCTHIAEGLVGELNKRVVAPGPR